MSNGEYDADGHPIDGAAVLDDLEAWFADFITVPDDADLSILALWTVHTHLAVECYTSPRLLIDSTMPGSGKTTVLDHLAHLCKAPVQAASLSSPAMLVRILDGGIRSVLIDETDRSLSPDKKDVGDLIAVLNSGYRRGATRPVLVPNKEAGWKTKEMPTFAPVALAGNSPKLPDDTRSRCIRILLMPDLAGRAKDSDWEMIEPFAEALRDRIAEFADSVRETLPRDVELDERCRGRAKEKWRPLKRVAEAAGGHWPQICDELIRRGLDEAAAEHEAGLDYEPPGMSLLRDLAKVWPKGETFVSTESLVSKLVFHNPQMWGSESSFGKPLTAHRFGRMLSQAAKITSTRQRIDGGLVRGIPSGPLIQVWDRLGVKDPPRESGTSGPSGTSGTSPSSDGISLFDNPVPLGPLQSEPAQGGETDEKAS